MDDNQRRDDGMAQRRKVLGNEQSISPQAVKWIASLRSQ